LNPGSVALTITRPRWPN